MKKHISFLNWRIEIENRERYSIDNDFFLLEKPGVTSGFNSPFKVDVCTAIICLKGYSEGRINLKPCTTQANSLTVLLPDQILEHVSRSNDFSALFIVMSRKFTESLTIQNGLPLFRSIYDHPVIPLDEETLHSLLAYYDMLKATIKMTDNPNRLETVKHLTTAFFYGIGYRFHKSFEDKAKTRHEVLLDDFLRLVKTHYREERSVKFYADKLCFTPKYLSTVIKENSGQSPHQWIDNYVVLEAKALLKSTNMTIQQITDELNFPSQSFFGKYFKRNVGLSPKEYRKG